MGDNSITYICHVNGEMKIEQWFWGIPYTLFLHRLVFGHWGYAIAGRIMVLVPLTPTCLRSQTFQHVQVAEKRWQLWQYLVTQTKNTLSTWLRQKESKHTAPKIWLWLETGIPIWTHKLARHIFSSEIVKHPFGTIDLDNWILHLFDPVIHLSI